MVQRLATIGFVVAVFISAEGVAHAAKDVVVTTSGDRLVGEIKSVEKDVLTFSTDYSDADFKIKWEKVASIESDRQFLVETFDGKRLSGALKADPPKKAAVRSATPSVPLPDVSMVQPFERTFWSRFDVGLDFGYSLTKTNSAKQLSLGGNLVVPGRAEPGLAVRQRLQELAGRMRPRPSAGTSATTSGTCWAPLVREHHAGPPEQRRTGARPADDDRRRRRPLPVPIGVRNTSPLGGGLAWTNENYTDPRCRPRTPPRRMSAPSS